MTKDLDEKELKKTIPMRRFGEAAEVADLVSFLVSEKASYIIRIPSNFRSLPDKVISLNCMFIIFQPVQSIKPYPTPAL